MRYSLPVIASFKCKEARGIYEGVSSRKLPQAIQQVARRKLKMVAAAVKLDDLRVPPNNRLEALRGGRKGQYSIRINNQWRICFRWSKGRVFDVEIVDYH